MTIVEDRQQSPADRKASAEAAAWMVRLYSEDRNPELERGLREWLKLHPRNSRHFEEMVDVWDLGGQVTSHGLPRMRSGRPARVVTTWPRAVAAAAVLAVVAVLFAGYASWNSSSYATEHGEQRIVRLADGSRVILNSGTRLQVELSEAAREVRLQKGEAYFEVAKDLKRPFIVSAGARTVTALGTAFVVRYEADRTAVTLVEGKVRIADHSGAEQPATSLSGSGAPALAVLAPGERLTFVEEKPPELDQPRIDTLTAWRRGEVLLDETPLSEAIAEMNRYGDRQLVIDDAQLGELRVSGIYRSGDSEQFARAVAELYGFDVAVDSTLIHLTR